MRTFWLLPALLLVGTFAGAQPLGVVTLGDLPGTDRHWQTGEVTVGAPAAEVQQWFSDATRWAERFPDDSAVRILGRAPDGRKLVEFHSKVLGKTLTVRILERPGLITYDGSGKGINTQGKILFEPLGPNRTKIVMQTTGELHGALGVLATEGMKRKRALAKLSADLNAAVRLARASAAAARPGG
jgi:hypothetical protein